MPKPEDVQVTRTELLRFMKEYGLTVEQMNPEDRWRVDPKRYPKKGTDGEDQSQGTL